MESSNNGMNGYRALQNLCNTGIKFILSNPSCAPNMEVTDTELKYIHES